MYVVLDEADKMLSLGLEPQLERLRAALLPNTPASASLGHAAGAGPDQQQAEARVDGPATRPRPQVQLWTATMPDALRAAAARWLLRPRRFRASTPSAAISSSVVQVWLVHAPFALCAHCSAQLKLWRCAAHPAVYWGLSRFA